MSEHNGSSSLTARLQCDSTRTIVRPIAQRRTTYLCVVAASSLLFGCPGQLDSRLECAMTREKLVACATDAATAPSGGTGGAGGAASCDAPTKVFKNQNYGCTAGPCHGAGNASGLDLLTDPKAALFGRPSATTLTKCPGEPLVATTAPASGVLFKRLEGNECGPMMPFGSISSEDLQCVKDWVTSELTKTSDEGE